MTKFNNYDLPGFAPVLSWNPIVMRCTRVDEGCRNCWHLRMSHRQAHNHTLCEARRGVMAGTEPNYLNPLDRDTPWLKRKPAIIATQFMGDLWHMQVQRVDRADVLETIRRVPRHIFLILTKRPENVTETLPDNCWIGTSVSDQASADKRMPDLLRINGGHKWVSVEPMLGPIDFYPHSATVTGPIEFAACGPETGPGARECEREWIAAVEDQCEMAGVTFYDKRDSIDPNFLGREWPDAWRKAVTQ